MFRPLLALALCAATGAASAQYGLQWGAPVADRTAQFAPAGWLVGLRVHLLDGVHAPLRIIGDHYLTGPGFGDEQVTGGLRVSGGLTIGAWRPGLPLASAARAGGGLVVQPYVGLGYSSLSARSGWGFAADIGLGGLRPGIALGFGHDTRGQGLDQVLERLRLAPVLQLGVSYAF